MVLAHSSAALALVEAGWKSVNLVERRGEERKIGGRNVEPGLELEVLSVSGGALCSRCLVHPLPTTSPLPQLQKLGGNFPSPLSDQPLLFRFSRVAMITFSDRATDSK